MDKIVSICIAVLKFSLTPIDLHLEYSSIDSFLTFAEYRQIQTELCVATGTINLDQQNVANQNPRAKSIQCSVCEQNR